MSVHDPYKDDRELRALRERRLEALKNHCSSLLDLNRLLQEVNLCNDRIHSCVKKEVEIVTSLPDSLLRHVTPRKTIKIKRTPAGLDEKRLSSGSRKSIVKPRKRKEGEQSATKGHKKAHQHSLTDSNRKLSSKTKHKSSTSYDAKVQSLSSTYLAPLDATDDGIHTLLTSNVESGSLPASDGGDSWMSKSLQPKSPQGASFKMNAPPTRIERILGRKKRRNHMDFAKMLNGESKKLVGHNSPPVLPNCQQSALPPSKQNQTPPTWKSNSKVVSPVSKTRPVGFVPVSTNKTGGTKLITDSGSRKRDIQLFAVLDTSVSPPLPRYVAKIVPESTAMLPLNNVVNPFGCSVAANSTHSSSTKAANDANSTLSQSSSTYLLSSATTPCRSNSTYSSIATQTRHTHPISNSTPLKTSKSNSIATQTNSTHSKSSPTHSTPATSSSTYTTFVHQNPVSFVHSKVTKTGVNNLKRQSTANTAGDKYTPRTPIIRLGDNKGSLSNPAFKCDHVGCVTSFDELQLLNLHKAKVHGAVSNKKTTVFQCNTLKSAKTSNVSMQAPKKVDDKKVPSCKEKVSEVKHANISQVSPQNMVSRGVKTTHANDGLPQFSQQVISVGDKRVPSYEGKPSCSNNGAQQGIQKTISVGRKRKLSSGDESDRKYIKLGFKLPSTPVYSTVASTWRNFARKSTGGSRPLKRRIAMKSLRLKLTKVSLKMPKTEPKSRLDSEALSRCPQPEQATLKQLLNNRSTLDRWKYKSLELFRDHIRSRLNLTISDECTSLNVESTPVGSMLDKRVPDSSCVQDEVYMCARVEPFCGNCARTKPFRTELRKVKDTGCVSHDSASSYLSNLNGASHTSVLQSQYKDERFPLVMLPPVVHHQPTVVTEQESLITTVPAQPVSQQTSASPSLKTPQGFGSESPGVGQLEPSLSPQRVGVVVQEDSVVKDIVLVESSSPECEDTKNAASTSRVPSSDQNADKLELVDVRKSPSSEYTLRLLETIAKLSGDVEGQKSRKSSVLSPSPVVEVSSSSEDEIDDEPCTSLMVSVDFSKLSRVPAPLPCPSLTEVGVVTNHLGSFTSQGVQVERGLILDKDVLESYLTVKVGEALYDLREKLERTERKVQEVMKEKDRLEKVLEMKVKLIKDLTTTGLKPLFVEKETMTDTVKDTQNMKVRLKARKTTSTQTHLGGIYEPPKGSLASNCMSQLSDKELDEHLRDSPSPTPLSEDDDNPSNEELPLSSKNRWMFEPSESARCSAFNMPVRFMRSLNQSVSGSEVASSDMISLNLLSRQICHIFTKIQRINQQLQALPLAGVLKDKVSLVTSSISHLLSHLPLADGSKKEFLNDTMMLCRLSFGTAAYSAGWKIKELHSLLAGIDASKLPAYFRAELNKVTKDTKNALDFGVTGVRNVTVNHSRQPLQTSEVDWFDLDFDDLLSSSDSDDLEEDNCLAKRDVVQEDTTRVHVGQPNRSADLANSKARGSDIKKQEGRHRKKEAKEKIHSKGVCKHRQLHFHKGVKNGGRNKKIERVLKMGRNELRNSKNSGRVSSATKKKLTTSLIVESSGARNTTSTSLPLPQQPPPQNPSTQIPKETTTADSGVQTVHVDPLSFITTSLPLPARNLSESLKLLNSLASAMPRVSTFSSSPKPATTLLLPSTTPMSTVLRSSTSQPLKSANSVAISPTAHVLSKPNHVNVSTGRVEITNLSSTEFTPIMKAISPTSTKADSSSASPKKRAVTTVPVTAMPVATAPQLSLPFSKHQGSTSTTFTSASSSSPFSTNPKKRAVTAMPVTATPVAIAPQPSLPFSKHQGSTSTTITSASSSSPASPNPKKRAVTAMPVTAMPVTVVHVPQPTLPFSKHQGSTLATSTTSTSSISLSLSSTKPKACTGPIATIPQLTFPFPGYQGSALAIASAKHMLHSQTSVVPSMPSMRTPHQPLILRPHKRSSPSSAAAHVPITSQMSTTTPLPVTSSSVSVELSQPTSRMQQSAAVSTPSIPTTSQSSTIDLSFMPNWSASTLASVPTLVNTVASLTNNSQAQSLTSAVPSQSVPNSTTLVAMPTPLVAMSTPLVATCMSTPLVAVCTTQPHTPPTQPTQNSKSTCTSQEAMPSCITSSAPPNQTLKKTSLILEATAHDDRSLLVVPSPEGAPSLPTVPIMLEAGPNVDDGTPSASSMGKTSTSTHDETAVPLTSSEVVPLTLSKPTTSISTEAVVSVVSTLSLRSVPNHPSPVSVVEITVTSSDSESGVVPNAVATEPSSLKLTSAAVATASSLPLSTTTPPMVVIATSQHMSKDVSSTLTSSSSSVVLPGSSQSPPSATSSSSTSFSKQSQASQTTLVADSSSPKSLTISEVSTPLTERCNASPASAATSVESPSSTVVAPLSVTKNSVASPILPLRPENYKNVFQDYVRQMHEESVAAAPRQSNLGYSSSLQNSAFGSNKTTRSASQKGLNIHIPATPTVFVNPIFQEIYRRALLRNLTFPSSVLSSILSNCPQNMYMSNSPLSGVTNVSVGSLFAPTTSVGASSSSVKEQSDSIDVKNSSTPSTSEKYLSNSSSEIGGQNSSSTTTILASSPAPSRLRAPSSTSNTSQSVGANKTSATTVTSTSVQELQPSTSTSCSSTSTSTSTSIPMATDTTTNAAARGQQGGKDEPPSVSKPGASTALNVSSAVISSSKPVSRCPKKQSTMTTTLSKHSSPPPKPKQPVPAPPPKATAGGHPDKEGKAAAGQAQSLSSLLSSSKTDCLVSSAENTRGVMKNVTQSSSLTPSLTRGSSVTADCKYFLTGGVNPQDIVPVLQVFHDLKGVLVKWTLPTKYLHLQRVVKVYEIYAFITDCNTEEIPPVSQTHWTKVGTIHPLKLPMAVTLNNILMTKRYSFSVRAVFDEPTQVTSQFSRPGSLRVE